MDLRQLSWTAGGMPDFLLKKLIDSSPDVIDIKAMVDTLMTRAFGKISQQAPPIDGFYHFTKNEVKFYRV